MEYNPNNELNEEQMLNLSEDDFLEYLDSKAQYLKQFTRPLGSYHAKRYASMAAAHRGVGLTEDEFQSAKKIGKEGDMENNQRVIDKLNGDIK